MSLKNMAIKMALAFAAAKGMQAVRDAGGMAGVKRKLAEQRKSGGGIEQMLSGMLGSTPGASPSGATGYKRSSGGLLGGVLGGLAAAQGGERASGKMRGLLDTTREGASIDDEVTAGLMLRAMVQAAHADGKIDLEEERQIATLIDDDDPNDRAFLERCLQEPVDPAALARDVPKGLEVEVYTAAVLAIEPDNRAEAEYLDKLARELKMEQQAVNDIHEAQGKPPLYTL